MLEKLTKNFAKEVKEDLKDKGYKDIKGDGTIDIEKYLEQLANENPKNPKALLLIPRISMLKDGAGFEIYKVDTKKAMKIISEK